MTETIAETIKLTYTRNPNDNNGYALEKGRLVRAWYRSLDADTRQLVDMARYELENGIQKRAEENGNQAWFGPVSSLELIFELGQLWNRE